MHVSLEYTWQLDNRERNDDCCPSVLLMKIVNVVCKMAPDNQVLRYDSCKQQLCNQLCGKLY